MDFIKIVLKSFCEKLMRLLGLVVLSCASPLLGVTLFFSRGRDETFNLALSVNHTDHIFGSFGANVADTFFQAFGVVAYVVPLVLMVWTLQYVMGWRGRLLPIRALSFFGFLLCLSALFALESPLKGGALGEVALFLLPLDTFWAWRLLLVLCFFFSAFCTLGVRKIHIKRTAHSTFVFLQEAYTSSKHFLCLFWGAFFNYLKQSWVSRAEYSPQKDLSNTLQTKNTLRHSTVLTEREDSEKLSTCSVDSKPAETPLSFSLKSKNASRATMERGVSPGEMPPLDLLRSYEARHVKKTQEETEESVHNLSKVLKEFGVEGRILDVREGPVVTLYEFEPAPGIKASRVINLAEDIARSMSALATRVAVIPGRNAIGIEMPNETREIVYLKDILNNSIFQRNSGSLVLALGKNIAGKPVVVDLARMPHLLVAGTTGSGKSVGINTMILSLLFRLSPKECQLLMIDPKMLELSVYNSIPHLIAPVITEPKKAVQALKWAVHEMEKRYKMMSNVSVRNIDSYNKKVQAAFASGNPLTQKVQTGFDENGLPIIETRSLPNDPLPYLVIVVDEMADLMLVAGKEIEGAIQRLAQMARAAGIHLIMATQRPSVDVITGTIKANFPSRVGFQVTSKIDSRTILGEQGAEQLLGQGDMLYMSPGERMLRVHGPFVSDEEVERVVSFLRKAYPDHKTHIDFSPENVALKKVSEEQESDLYREALRIVVEEKKTSTSYLQRRLQIGYNRAARLIEELEANGVVSAPNHMGKRDLLSKVS